MATNDTRSDTSSQTSCCQPGYCTPAAQSTAGAGARNTPKTSSAVVEEILRKQVRDGYAHIAQVGSWSAAALGTVQQPTTLPQSNSQRCCPPSPRAGGGCCGPATFSPEQLAHAIGYSQADLGATPSGANMGLSCGNPTALASLKQGEVVLDLGSGGGFDCFVAGPKVGAKGRVIGVDMTTDMLSKARANLAGYTNQTGLTNVEFRLGEIEHLPIADASVDVVISNCVLNLSPDKPQVWREIYRVLRPGGRVAVSDLALLAPLPPAVLADVEALVGCVAGAVLVEETRRDLLAAGLCDCQLTPKSDYIDAMTNWEDPLYRKIVDALPQGSKPSDYITSLDIAARKPVLPAR